MLAFDNSFISNLPGDQISATYPRQVLGALWSRVATTPVASPRLLAYSPEMTHQLGLTPEVLAGDWLDALSGNGLRPGMAHYATNYGGHQFGQWAGQLGDGRAIFLGEALTPAGERLELQLKGAGPTPFSRRGDGRAVLRSSLREFLCSEAMHHLGIPTTRALSLVTTGETVLRDMFYDGRAEAEPGAIVCRVSPSFTRFGHFELPTARGDDALLRQLIDYTIARDFPDFAADPDNAGDERISRWFAVIARRTAELVVHWMRVGFVHGVMNTDNMSILGLTIDYGPYGWIDDFDPAWTPNTTDAQGRRYCFARQPEIARWNLERLADALSPATPDPALLDAGLSAYDSTYTATFRQTFASKFGFVGWRDDDEPLVADAFRLMQRSAMDMTLFFRLLADSPGDATRLARLAETSYAAADFTRQAPEWATWLARWDRRIQDEGRPANERRQTMNAVNPCYIPRNYLAQQAIDAAQAGDASPLLDLLDTLRTPYREQAGREAYAAKRPEWARHKPGCSMLSCSS